MPNNFLTVLIFFHGERISEGEENIIFQYLGIL